MISIDCVDRNYKDCVIKPAAPACECKDTILAQF